MALPAINEPAAPADPANIVQLELQKLVQHKCEKQTKAWQCNSEHAHALVLGQCSWALCSRMEAHEDWAATDDASDIMALLGLTQNCMIQQQTRKHPVHTLIDAESSLFGL